MLQTSFRPTNTNRLHAMFDQQIEWFKSGSKASELDQYFIEDLNKERLTIDYRSLEIKDQLQGGKINPIVDPSQEQVDGVTDLERGKLQNGHYMALGGFTLLYGWSEADDAVYDVDYHRTIFAIDQKEEYQSSNTSNWVPYTKQIIPNELLNAEFRLLVDNKIIARCLGSSLFVHGTPEDIQWSGESVYPLHVPAFIGPDMDIQFEVRFGNGVTVPPGHHYMNLQLEGLTTLRRNAAK
jgi:hypothetical protein